MPTWEPQEVTSMDISQGRKKTGTVPTRFVSYNDRMKRSPTKTDRRHRHKSNGKERREIMSNKNRNLTEIGEPSQETQLKRPMPTTREPTITSPTIGEPTMRTPAFTDHEDRKRKPKSTADRAAKMKTERSQARDKSHTKRRDKQSLFEKIAGPLIPPPLRSRRPSLEGGEAARGGNSTNSNTSNIQPGEQTQGNRGNSAQPDPEPRQEPDPIQQGTGNQAVYQTMDTKVREKVTCPTDSSGSFNPPPGEEAHKAGGT